jgi:myo-inositol-1(or 4)-monophosphatase
LPDVDRRPPADVTARLVAAVREAGEVALKTFRGPIRQWLKERASPVCEADIAVDRLLREQLAGEDYGWLSEEAEADPSRLDAKCVWIVDPIDGTRAYLAGQTDWCISVALAIEGRPAVAAIFAPATDEFFLATAGGGATHNGVPIRTAPGADFAGAKVAGPKRLVSWLSDSKPEVLPVPRIGSLALRLARVAQGELDVTFAGGMSHDWDLAAADLLVHEAGGTITTFDGQTLVYNRPEVVHDALVAAGHERHARLMALMRERAPKPA